MEEGEGVKVEEVKVVGLEVWVGGNEEGEGEESRGGRREKERGEGDILPVRLFVAQPCWLQQMQLLSPLLAELLNWMPFSAKSSLLLSPQPKIQSKAISK